MSIPTNRSEARDLLRKVVADCDLAERGLREDLEDAIADLVLDQIAKARLASEAEVERKTLTPVFNLINSAKFRLKSIQAFHHLQRFEPQMLAGNNQSPMLDKLVIDAIEDLDQAANKDERIPF